MMYEIYILLANKVFSFYQIYYLQKLLLITTITAVTAQRCDKGNKVCQKLEADDPVFQGQRCETPADCKGRIDNI